MHPLRRHMIDEMQIRNLTPNTQRTYTEQVARFARYFGKSPEHLGPAEIRTYLLHLVNEGILPPVPSSSQWRPCGSSTPSHSSAAG